MECNKEEAFRAKQIAERRFAKRDFVGAKKYAAKAETLYPNLDGISQMVATFDVYVASVVQINGETDFYSVLGLSPLADSDAVRKQYRKLALMLHPDKNKTVGAEGAFKLVSEAWTLLSDHVKRTSYDLRLNRHSSTSTVQAISLNQPKLPPTFWTFCSSCQVQYEYLRKYVNKRLSCKNCRSTFIAVETGTVPVNGSTPFCSWSFYPENGHRSHGYNGASYFPANTILFTGNGVSRSCSGLGSEYIPNISFQWSPFPNSSSGVVGAPGPGLESAFVGAIHQNNEKINGAGEKVKTIAKDNDFKKTSSCGYNEPSVSKADRPKKKRRVDKGGSFRSVYEQVGSKPLTSELTKVGRDGSVGPETKLSISSVNPTRRCSAATAFDARKLLIDMARTEIRKKLEEMRLAAAEKAKVQPEVHRPEESLQRAVGTSVDRPKPNNKPESISITVPDSDFHDFDKDRSEGCFKPKQIWALYDEEDGMPRLYCLIREVISAQPFKIHISYLISKTDSEFGSVNWVDSGFTKSCGNFRASNSDIIDKVNIFSHVLSGGKGGRGGCIRIFPKRGDIWAVYRNWSPNWNRTTPDEVRHQYEMVEVLDDYTEELGVCVSHLVKLVGYNTVYQRNMDKKAIRWIPRREMVRFSHQVPSFLLKDAAANLPADGCWDLDPAATPDELLQVATEIRVCDNNGNCAGK